MTDFTQDEKALVNGKSLADFTHVVRLSGNCQGFDLESVYDWHSKYFSVFQDYLQRGSFVGKDQNLMATACLESNLCLLFKSNGDWFQLQKYLTGLHPQRKYHRLQTNWSDLRSVNKPFMRNLPDDFRLNEEPNPNNTYL